MRRSVSAGVIAAVVVIVVVVAAVGAYYYMTRGGTVYFYLTDPGNPSSSSSNSSPTAIYLTITSIMIHSTSKGWITVSNKTMTVQLSSPSRSSPPRPCRLATTPRSDSSSLP